MAGPDTTVRVEPPTRGRPDPLHRLPRPPLHTVRTLAVRAQQSVSLRARQGRYSSPTGSGRGDGGGRLHHVDPHGIEVIGGMEGDLGIPLPSISMRGPRPPARTATAELRDGATEPAATTEPHHRRPAIDAARPG